MPPVNFPAPYGMHADAATWMVVHPSDRNNLGAEQETGGLFITANARRLLAGDKVCSGPLGTARDGSGRPGTARDGSGPLGMLGMKRVKPKLLMKNH